MNRHLVFLTGQGKDTGAAFHWEQALIDADFVLLRAGALEQAIAIVKSHPLIAVLVDLDLPADEVSRSIVQFSDVISRNTFPLLGIASGSISEDDLTKWAQDGLTGLIGPATPSSFLLAQLKSSQIIEELQVFKETAIGVRSLAAETRSLIHTLAQPLSALQGRLQLALSQCPPDDPLRKSYENLVKLAIEVTKSLHELQELHRKFS